MPRSIDELKRLIDDNPAITMRAMSQHFGYNRQSSLTEFFKDHTGMTPLAYRAKARLDRARHLLTNTNRRVCDISLEVGYGSTAAFGLFFRNATGMSPRQYRLAEDEKRRTPTAPALA